MCSQFVLCGSVIKCPCEDRRPVLIGLISSFALPQTRWERHYCPFIMGHSGFKLLSLFTDSKHVPSPLGLLCFFLLPGCLLLLVHCHLLSLFISFFFVNICSIAPDASLAAIMRREVAFRASSGSKEKRTIERTDFIFCFSSLCPIVVFVGPHLHKLSQEKQNDQD